MTIKACRRSNALLRIRPRLWAQLREGLDARANGVREAGAFLLGQRSVRLPTISRVVYYDDLDSEALTGAIHLHGTAYPKLWDLCDDEGLRILGDVHTHGGTGVRQSSIDEDNPMVARDGHIALIVPHLAAQPFAPHEVGVHRYNGSRGWDHWLGRDAARQLYVGWLA